MSKTPIKLKLPIEKPGSLSLAEKRRRFLQAARETGCGNDEPDSDAALCRTRTPITTFPKKA